MPSVSVKDVSQQDFTVALAAHLKKSGKMKVPEWVDLVKTNNRKELVRSWLMKCLVPSIVVLLSGPL